MNLDIENAAEQLNDPPRALSRKPDQELGETLAPRGLPRIDTIVALHREHSARYVYAWTSETTTPITYPRKAVCKDVFHVRRYGLLPPIGSEMRNGEERAATPRR